MTCVLMIHLHRPFLLLAFHIQEAWKSAIQRRESLESGPAERAAAIAEKENEALASLEAAKSQLKSATKSLFRASNLSPPVMGTGGKRQLMMQQSAQMGLHAFCLHLLDGLDECWQKARHLGDHALLSYDKVRLAAPAPIYLMLPCFLFFVHEVHIGADLSPLFRLLCTHRLLQQLAAYKRSWGNCNPLSIIQKSWRMTSLSLA